MNSKTTTPGTLHLLCGLPGAGKSTFAQKLEIETRGVVLNHDLWLIGIFGESAEAAWDKHFRSIWSLVWGIAERLLLIGVDVILDFGLWHRSERDYFRDKADRIGARSLLYFVTCSPEEQINRIAERNAQLGARNIAVDPAKLAKFKLEF